MEGKEGPRQAPEAAERRITEEDERMRIEVTQTITEYMKVGGEYKFVDVKQKLSFATWDDFQNWTGYMVEALEGKSLNIEVKVVKEA